MKPLVMLLLLYSHILVAQVRIQDPLTGKWGYRDAEWNILVPAIYDEVQPNFDTIMAVKKDGKMAALDEKGRYRIPLIYEHIRPNLSPFRSQFGYAAVTKNSKTPNTWGMVDARGKILLPEKFQYVRALTPALLVGRVDGDSLLQFYDTKGQLLYKIAGSKIEPLDIDNTCFGVDGIDHQTRFYKLDGTPVYPADPKSGRWTDGQRTILFRDRHYGMIDSKGKTVIPFEFSNFRHGLPGHFIVEKRDEKYVYGGMAVYDKNGKPVIPLAYHSIQPFGEVYRIHDPTADRSGIVSRTGAEILPPKYHFSSVHISEYDYGKNLPDSRPERYISATELETRQQFLIRDDGRVIRPEGSQYVVYHGEKHPLIVTLKPDDEKELPWKMAMDFRGKTLLPAEYRMLDFTSDPNVLIGSREPTGGIGFIHLDAPGNTEFKYSERYRFANGYYRMAGSQRQFDLYSPALELVHSGQYNWFSEPGGQYYEQFRAANRAKEKLVAVAFRQDMVHGEWLAITESGQALLFKDPPKQAPPAKVENPVEPEVVVMEEAPAARPAVAPASDAEAVIQEFDVQKAPEFPGGKDSLNQYLIRNLKYPRLAAENAIQGMTALTFIVEKDGTLSNVQIVRDIGGGCGAEAKRLLEAMPKWTPGQKNGRNVRVMYTLPVRFRLE